MLVDTGSAVTLVRSDVLRGSIYKYEEIDGSSIVAANGEQMRVCGRVEVEFKIHQLTANHTVLVVEDLTQRCLLGADFLLRFGCVVDIKNKRLTMEDQEPIPLIHANDTLDSVCHLLVKETTEIPGRHQFQLPVSLSRTSLSTSIMSKYAENSVYLMEPEEHFINKHGVLVARSLISNGPNSYKVVRVVNPSSSPVKVYKDERVGQIQQFDPQEMCLVETGTQRKMVQSSNLVGKEEVAQKLVTKVEGLSQNEQKQLENFLFEFAGIFATDNSDLGKTSIVQHKVETGTTPPIRLAPTRLPYHQRSVVREMLQGMVQHDIIEPSCSPWSSPIVLVKKKDGTYRFCVDYRHLNECTKKSCLPASTNR